MGSLSTEAGAILAQLGMGQIQKSHIPFPPTQNQPKPNVLNTCLPMKDTIVLSNLFTWSFPPNNYKYSVFKEIQVANYI